MALVHHLRSADHIIALGQNGNVVEQGTFAELDSKPGYIKSLAVAAAKKDQDSSVDIEEDDHTAQDVATLVQASKVADDARRLGEFSVYNYYMRALTLWRLFIFIGLEAFSVSAYGFIRKSPDHASGSHTDYAKEFLVQWWSAANGRHTNFFISIAFLLPILSSLSQVGYL